MTTPDYRDDRPARRNTQPRTSASYSDNGAYRNYDRQQDARAYREPTAYRESDRYYQPQRESRSYRESERDYQTYRQPQNRPSSDNYQGAQRRTSTASARRPQPARRSTQNRRTYSDTPVNNRTYGYDDQPRRQPAYADRPQRPYRADGYAGRTSSAPNGPSGIFDALPWLRWVLAALAALVAFWIARAIVRKTVKVALAQPGDSILGALAAGISGFAVGIGVVWLAQFLGFPGAEGSSLLNEVLGHVG